MRRFAGIFTSIALVAGYLAFSPGKAAALFSMAGSNFLVVLSILPPVFVLYFAKLASSFCLKLIYFPEVFVLFLFCFPTLLYIITALVLTIVRKG